MDKRSLGSLLIQLRDRDKLRLFDKETNKEYIIYGGARSYNAIKDQYILDLAIREVK